MTVGENGKSMTNAVPDNRATVDAIPTHFLEKLSEFKPMAANGR